MFGRDYKKGYFKLSEFVRKDDRPTKKAIGKIIGIIEILNPLRIELKKPIIILIGSVSKEYEISQGRTGRSQHVYKNNYLGAVKVTCEIDYLEELYSLLLNQKEIKRVCIYREYTDRFIHFDFKPSKHKKFESIGGVWKKRK